ncbi:hypothetical protein T11_17867 [Trichinella zimbabwensis]|uniref:Uncharacterized protein n=1 Tax=Trichinella zimbabwensis TaxID=268475 RepID=A0A0V1GGW6_9BILA|nr:hypothetical protein T11_17867 [Trichinella zimbabwensis]
MIKHRYGDRYLHNEALEISFKGLALSEDLLLIGHFIFGYYICVLNVIFTIDLFSNVRSINFIT